MGGGLLQLKFLGREAEFFVGNPQISFFKSVFRSFSNYSKNLMDVYFEAPLDFNKTHANIPVLEFNTRYVFKFKYKSKFFRYF